MPRPRKVVQHAREAEELHKRIYGDGENPPAEPPKPPLTTVEPMTPGDEPPAEPPKAEAPPAEPPKAEAPPAEPLKPKQEDTLEYWKNRALSEEGRDRAIVDENRRLREDLAGLRGMVTTLTAAKEKAAAEPIAAVQEPLRASSLLKPNEVEEYGADLIDVMKRAARDAVSTEFRQLREENRKLREDLGSVQTFTTRTARDGVYAALNNKVANWQDINTSVDFRNWLEQQDPFAGLPRGAMLQEAFEENNAARVVAFFEGFLREQETVVPAQQPQATAPTPPARSLDTMVAPGKPRGGTAQAQESQKRIWTQREIHDFYRKVTDGRFRGREKEQRQIEQDIIAAGREGRVQF